MYSKFFEYLTNYIFLLDKFPIDSDGEVSKKRKEKKVK